MPANYILIGASGYIGSRMERFLNQLGESVLSFNPPEANLLEPNTLDKLEQNITANTGLSALQE